MIPIFINVARIKHIYVQAIWENLSRSIPDNTGYPDQNPPMILQGESVQLRNSQLR